MIDLTNLKSLMAKATREGSTWDDFDAYQTALLNAFPEMVAEIEELRAAKTRTLGWSIRGLQPAIDAGEPDGQLWRPSRD